MLGGNGKFISQYVTLSEADKTLAEELASQGKTPIYLAIDENKLIGILAVADTIKEDGILAIKELKEMNYSVVMLTGDNAKTAEAKTTEHKQENNNTAVSATNENAKQNVAENTSDSKKVASNRDVNVIINDATTDEKAATKSSVQTDKDVNANKLDTNTVSVNKLQRNFNVA